MRCREVELLLAEYADGELAPECASRVASHLDACPRCRTELESLRRSLAALDAAGRRPAPDLWEAFQTRLAREAPASDCVAIREWLPGYRDPETAPELAGRVRAHLAECRACAAEERSLFAPLALLEEAGNAAAPDLWPRFSQRLADTVRCDEVDALLPSLLGHEPVPRGVALQRHLTHCERCARSASAFAGAMSTLDRVARTAPAIDLWPAFADRLRAERERSARADRFQGVRLVLSWLRGPLLQPAFGFAAFALIALGAQYLTAPERNADWAKLVRPRRETAAATARRATRPKVAAALPARPAPVPEIVDDETEDPPLPAVAAPGPGKTREKRRPEASVLPPAETPTPEVRVAFNLPAPTGESAVAPETTFAPPGVNTVNADQRRSEQDGMAAVVLAVEILADREDALLRPFDAHVNE